MGQPDRSARRNRHRCERDYERDHSEQSDSDAVQQTDQRGGGDHDEAANHRIAAGLHEHCPQHGAQRHVGG